MTGYGRKPRASFLSASAHTSFLALSSFLLLTVLAGCGLESAEPEGRDALAEHVETGPEPSGPEADEVSRAPSDTGDRSQQVRVSSAAGELERLEALGYVEALPAAEPERRGVTLNHPSAYPGVNLYYSRRDSAASLLDMEGRGIHRWERGPRKWQHVELDSASGEIYVLVKDDFLMKLDRDSKLLWRLDGRFHHDLTLAPEGLVAIERRAKVFPAVHPQETVLEDLLTLIDAAAGERRKSVSLLGLLEGSDYRFLLPRLDGRRLPPVKGDARRELDVLHTNHVQRLGDAPCARPPFVAGSYLVSLRNLHMLALVDAELQRIEWAWGPGNLTFQHHPTFLDSCTLLVFNNGSRESEVLEIDPYALEIVDSYQPGKEFFSHLRGSAQRLPNGNTLITNSDSGQVFEITPEHQKVWEFWNPDVDDAGERGALWRMLRFERDALGFLDG